MSEIVFQRRNTKAFIEADPVVLSLIPVAKTPVAGGGHRWVEQEPMEPQTFRLIPQSDIMPTVQTPDGMQLTPTYVLLGEHNCQMERLATFTLNGVKFKIVSPVRPDFRDPALAYQRKADVARL